MKIIATKVKCKDLKPGDLFSAVSQTYWDAVRDDKIVGEKVYIRSNNPCPKEQEEDDIFLIQIIKK